MGASSSPGGRTKALLAQARAAEIRRTAGVRAFLSFVVILVLLRGLAQGMSSTLRDPSTPFIELVLQALIAGLLLALLWWVWTAAGGRDVRRLQNHLKLESATAQTLDRLEGTAALHDRRVGRYGQHLEHLLVGAHAVAILANLDGPTDEPADAAAAQRKQADALAMAACDLEGMLRAPVLPVLVGEKRDVVARGSSTVLVQPRDQLARLVNELGPEPDEQRTLEVARACPPW